MAKEPNFWIADDVIAHVDNGCVTISIQRPTRFLPQSKANKVANRIWLESQLHKLELAKKLRETIDIPLTDRRQRSFLRLGGGFLIVQGKRIILIRRGHDAPRRACQLCECGGIFEVVDDNPYHPSNDFIASLLKECAEVALIKNEKVYVPVLAIDKKSIDFQPPGLQVSDYDDIVHKEFKDEIASAKLPIHYKTSGKFGIIKFHASILNYENSAKLQFADSPTISVDFTAESDSSSLEFVGVLSFPDDVDLAAIAFLEGKIGKNKKEEETLEVLRTQSLRENKPTLEYWDTEHKVEEDIVTKTDVFIPLNRDILLIDIQNGDTEVWHSPEKTVDGVGIDPDDADRIRECRKTNLWSELSRTHLAETDGRHTTEKAEKAIKMHSPLPWLQPLITL